MFCTQFNVDKYGWCLNIMVFRVYCFGYQEGTISLLLHHGSPTIGSDFLGAMCAGWTGREMGICQDCNRMKTCRIAIRLIFKNIMMCNPNLNAKVHHDNTLEAWKWGFNHTYTSHLIHGKIQIISNMIAKLNWHI